jgi:adenosylcobinamide-phosphate synthase
MFAAQALGAGVRAMIGSLSVWMTCVLALAGVALDLLLGEPRRAHPLVGFGRMAKRIERMLNPDRDAGQSNAGVERAVRGTRSAITRARGVLAWSLAVLPPVALSVLLVRALPAGAAYALHALLLWFALGARSLSDHIAPIETALAAGDLPRARELASRIVTRDLSDADETAIARAAVESALENGNDAIFGALFWFALAGGPGALAFRLANTLDAMWGYRTPRLRFFGWAAARLDDAANYVPARLTALAYAVCGDCRTALRCWREQALAWDSPNAGPVMASGAGSLKVACGGTARYHGVDEARPPLGVGAAPRTHDIGRARALVSRALVLWLAALVVLAALSAIF